MGRQWLHAKRAIVNLKKGQVVGKLVKEITVAAKLGGPDPEGNARLFAVLEKARKAGVTGDAIERWGSPIASTCTRVPVRDGHTEVVSLALRKPASADEIAIERD